MVWLGGVSPRKRLSRSRNHSPSRTVVPQPTVVRHPRLID
ncbi:hypothetical protein PpBr36_04055 [Pyricularia pennisetigena]|nr:hypothetical protein PpBr36_04055 [Pyricularia pennisetigena]TLS27663.1 hypothetical protein PpBr36_04055 [Pyricularia pennisetigena]